MADAGRTNADTPKPLAEAARVLDDVVQHPAVQEAGKKASQVLQQVGAEIDRVASSEEVKKTLQQVSQATGKTIQSVKQQVTRAVQPEPAGPASSTLVKQRPCLRCGELNRKGAPYCASCGAAYDAPAAPLAYAVAFASHVGLKRANNEDTARVWSFAPHGLAAWALLVADGMGGAASGEVASQKVAEVVEQEIRNRWNAASPQQKDLQRWLRVIVRQANGEIYRQAQANPAQQGMGATTTLAWLEGNLVTIAHVGDSRAYLIPPAGPAWQITQDHTMVALLVALGELTPEEAAANPQNNLLYRSVGIDAQVEVDTLVRRLASGDRLLLCSDGLHRYVALKELATLVRNYPDPDTACRNLINLANLRGGEDNISVIVVQAQAAPAARS